MSERLEILRQQKKAIDKELELIGRYEAARTGYKAEATDDNRNEVETAFNLIEVAEWKKRLEDGSQFPYVVSKVGTRVQHWIVDCDRFLENPTDKNYAVAHSIWELVTTWEAYHAHFALYPWEEYSYVDFLQPPYINELRLAREFVRLHQIFEKLRQNDTTPEAIAIVNRLSSFFQAITQENNPSLRRTCLLLYIIGYVLTLLANNKKDVVEGLLLMTLAEQIQEEAEPRYNMLKNLETVFENKENETSFYEFMSDVVKKFTITETISEETRQRWIRDKQAFHLYIKSKVA